MRGTREKKHRSASWWGVFLFACLAMAIYMAFDLLDVDGSSLRDLGRGAAIAAESPSPETDRMHSQGLSTVEGQTPITIHLESWLGAESPQRFSHRSIGPAFVGRDCNRPRAHLFRVPSSANSRIEEPA